MKIKMKLLSDAVFGNGMSVPGGEDIAVLCDEQGFPYYKGGTFKGIFREEFMRYLYLTTQDENEVKEKIVNLLGEGGDSNVLNESKMVFSDFHLSEGVKKVMLEEIGENHPEEILESLSHIRTFTSITEDGMTKEGSLRSCRCVNKGLYFYSEVQCQKEDEETVEEVLSFIKWVGSMRNRGFGKVKIEVEQ